MQKNKLLLCMTHAEDFPAIAGSTLEDIREYIVEGTSFNPSAGGIVGKSELYANMEVIIATKQSNQFF